MALHNSLRPSDCGNYYGQLFMVSIHTLVNYKWSFLTEIIAISIMTCKLLKTPWSLWPLCSTTVGCRGHNIPQDLNNATLCILKCLQAHHNVPIYCFMSITHIVKPVMSALSFPVIMAPNPKCCCAIKECIMPCHYDQGLFEVIML